MSYLSSTIKPNNDVRDAVASANFFQWQLAAELGLSDGALSRKLRTELSAREKEACFEALERMKTKRQHLAEGREA